MKAVGEERENVKTERLLASVGERESKLELPLVRGVRWQLQEAEDGGVQGRSSWRWRSRKASTGVGDGEGGGIEERGGICHRGWVRREARWEAEFVEGASGEQAGLEA